MLCDNCKKNQANVRYSENINGVERELNLCSECVKKLGLDNMEIDWKIAMPMDFPSFLGEFMEEFENPEFLPFFNDVKQLKCKNCGYTFEDIANTGRLGCDECYNIFESKLDPIIKKIQGSNLHTGRVGRILENNVENKTNHEEKKEQKNENMTQLEKLQLDLKKAIKEEKYEQAAELRDKIKEIENKKEE